MRSVFASFILLAALCAHSATAATLDVEGSLPRDLSTGQFTIDITISGVSQADRDAGAQESGPGARFDISVGNDNQEVLFAVPPEAGYDASDRKYWLELVEETPVQQDPNVATQYQYHYKLRIVDNPNNPTTLEEDVKDNKLLIDVAFYLGGSDTQPVAEEEDITITRDFYLATETPVFTVTGIYERLIADYEAKELIATTDGLKPSSKLNFVIVDTAIVTGDVTLPAKTFSGSLSVDDTAAVCEYVAANIDGDSCIVCPEGEQVYLDLEALKALNGFDVSPANANKPPHPIGNLDNRSDDEDPYVVFAQYAPDGIVQSACQTARPKRDETLTEANGGGEAKEVDVRCFIATAAYGSPWHGSVNLFRGFRDRVLLKGAIGQWMVEAYYELSPDLAAAIEDSPVLKAATRATLTIPALILDMFYDDDEIESYQTPY